MVERHGNVEQREFAAYLRRLADEVDAGRAACDVVKVERGAERIRELTSWTGEHGYVKTMDTGETHEIRVVSLRRVEVKRCVRCGAMHEVGAGCLDQRAYMRREFR